ncbi:hypothetical protein LTR08_001459 [Meristemomyces frigidus]|nr:hypothetical protein LTR08_001459 [Meristemomyces frigidus]
MTTPHAESTVLTPLDPSVDTNPDDWPEFELTNARVHLPHATDPAAVVSLLLATEHHPLTVTGQLQPVPAELASRYRGASTGRTDSIEVRDVLSFAYGQYGDGSVALWAAGRAGWYTLKPSRAYKAVYNDMVAAVKLLYFVADAYREPRTAGTGKHATVLPEYSAQDFFAHYATEMLGDADAVAVAEETVCGHRDFLFTSMLGGKEGLVWTRNPLYRFLRKKFPQDHQLVVQRRAAPEKEKKGVPAQRARVGSAETSSTTVSLKRKRGRPPMNRGADVISLGSSSAASFVMVNSAASSHAKTAAQTKAIALRRSRQPDPTAVETVTETESEQTATPIAVISDSDDEPNRRAHKGKSALRPLPRKGASKGGKAKAFDLSNDEEGIAEDQGEARASPTTSKFRNKTNPPTETRPRKRRSSKHSLDEGIDIPSSPSEPDATLGAPGGGHTPPPYPAFRATDAAALAHIPDQLQEDTYRCALDNCNHKVYSASRPDGQRLIREHYALHAYDDDQRVQLVRRLEQPSLPIGRLMERVKGSVRMEGFPGSRVAGTRFPERIVQRF